ncbi:hypothetical protein ACFU9B_41485 [Streptomyces sp. NPDC057592]|uniref:hypothetical protein n=1 Tax=unclassified Streptomyces TaxID=2593676 RepID=UPI0036CD62E6
MAEAPVSVAEVPVLSLAQVDEIADRAESDDHAVDWDRVRAAVRAVRPVRSLTVIGLGIGPAWVWADRVAGPVSASVSVYAAFAAAVGVCVVAAVGAACGGRIRRWVCAALLVAAVGGSLIADPTRRLVAAWIVGA